MSEAPLPAVLLGESLWRRIDEAAFELCRLRDFRDGFILDGRVLTLIDNTPAEVHYAVLCGRNWVTRNAHVIVIHGQTSRRLELRRDSEGRWWSGEQHIAGLDGVPDVDLAFTPATNTLPIRRLALGVGESAPAEALWIGFPSLEIERLSQTYEHTGDTRYRYGCDGGDPQQLDVDGIGLVVRYGGRWERVTADA